jgi:hypothetical protein
VHFPDTDSLTGKNLLKLIFLFPTGMRPQRGIGGGTVDAF